MVSKIYVATANAAFGELIQQSLGEHGGYQVEVLGDSEELLACCQEAEGGLAILDCDGEDQVLNLVLGSLKKRNPSLRLVIIPPEDDPLLSRLNGIPVEGKLERPVYLPDLFDIVDRILADVPDEPAAVTADIAENSITSAHTKVAISSDRLPNEPPDDAWMENPGEAELRLASRLTSISAHSALLVRETSLWVYVGRLSRSAAEELAALVIRYWDLESQCALARYVRLSGKAGEVMLYAVPLNPQTILALAYDVAIPISRIRSQAPRLVRRLYGQPVVEEPLAPELPEALKPARSQNGYEVETWGSADPSEIEPKDSAPVERTIDEEKATAEFLAMLASFPPPDPEFQPVSDELSQKHPLQEWFNEQSGEPFRPQEDLPVTPLTDAQGELPPLDEEFLRLLVQAEAEKEAQPDQALQAAQRGWPDEVVKDPGETAIDPAAEEDATDAGIDSLEDTQPIKLQPASKLEPAFPGVADVTYTGVLLPRIPDHHLTGKLGNSLSHWLQELCLSYGWRLEGMVIRPDYVHWIVRVVPAISPSSMLRVFRRQTSQWIFRDFPQFKEDNLSEDFWAPGYMILSGSQYPTASLLQDYKQQTRQRQGIV